MQQSMRSQARLISFCRRALWPALLLAVGGCSGQHAESEAEPEALGSARSALTSYKLNQPYVTWSWSGILNKLETDLKFTADPGSATTYFLAHQFTLVNSSGQPLL